MQQLRIAALALIGCCAAAAAEAQTSPADYLRTGEAVDRALGPNAELAPPPLNDAVALPPPAPPPAWFSRQPFDQQPFFATNPSGRRNCVFIPGVGFVC